MKKLSFQVVIPVVAGLLLAYGCGGSGGNSVQKEWYVTYAGQATVEQEQALAQSICTDHGIELVSLHADGNDFSRE